MAVSIHSANEKGARHVTDEEEPLMVVEEVEEVKNDTAAPQKHVVPPGVKLSKFRKFLLIGTVVLLVMGLWVDLDDIIPMLDSSDDSSDSSDSGSSDSGDSSDSSDALVWTGANGPAPVNPFDEVSMGTSSP